MIVSNPFILGDSSAPKIHTLLPSLKFWRLRVIELLLMTKEVPDAIAEFGIFRGGTFIKMARIAEKWNKEIYGIDSFEGMDRPGKHDNHKYREGKFNNTSKKFIEDKMEGIGCHIIQGFIPRILVNLEDVRFSFVRLDLDHYGPTLYSLQFVWDRLNKNGILCCHDYFKGKNIMASKACDDFDIPFEIIKTTAWWRKNNACKSS